VTALHLGVAGDPTDEWHWRALLTSTSNWGTYDVPFVECSKQTYLLGEATYKPRWASGWAATLGLALDHGTLIGNSTGAQLTICKTLNLKE